MLTTWIVISTVLSGGFVLAAVAKGSAQSAVLAATFALFGLALGLPEWRVKAPASEGIGARARRREKRESTSGKTRARSTSSANAGKSRARDSSARAKPPRADSPARPRPSPRPKAPSIDDVDPLDPKQVRRFARNRKASELLLRRARVEYRRRARSRHPDVGGSHDEFLRLARAYDKVREILGEEEGR